MAGEEEHLDIVAELQDDVSAPAAAASASIDELGDQARQTDRQLALLERRAKKTGNALAFLALKAEAANLAFKTEGERIAWMNDRYVELTKRQNAVTKSTNRLTAAKKKLNKATFDGTKHLKGFLGFLKKINSTIFRTVKYTTLFAGALALAGLVVKTIQLAPAILGISGSLLSLLSLALLLPTALGAVVATFLSLKLALKGVGEALSAGFAGDAEKFNEAMKKLSPAARQFVKDMVKFAPQLKALQQDMQNRFFTPLQAEVIPLLRSTIPVLQKGTGLLTDSLGRLAANFARFIGSARGAQFLMTLFRAANRLVQGLNNSLQPLMHGFADLIDGVEKHWDRLVHGFETGSVRFSAWLTRIVQNGQLDRWLDLAFETSKMLLDLFQAIGRFFRAFMVASNGNALANLTAFFDRAGKWLSSTEGQKAIVSFFQSLARAGEVLFPILTIVADAIANILAPSIADIVEGLAPGFTAFLVALADALRILMPMWKPLAEAVGSLLQALIPILPVLAQLIRLFGLQLAGVIMLLAGILGPFLQVIMTPLATILQMFGDIIAANLPFIERFMKAFADGLTLLAPIIAQLATDFSARFLKFLPELIAMWERMAPLIEQLAILFGQLLVAAFAQLLPILPDLFDAFFDLLTVFTQPNTQRAIQDILRALIQFLPLIIDALPGLMMFTILFLQALTAAVRFSAVVLSVMFTIANAVRTAVIGIGEVLGKLFEMFTKPFVMAYEVITGILGAIRDAIEQTFKDLSTAVKSGGSFLKNLNPLDLFRAGGGPVTGGKGYVVGEVGPERFLGDNGVSKDIGTGGPEFFTPPGSGMIVPNYMVKAMDSMEKSMDRAMERLYDPYADARHEKPEKTEHHYHYENTFNMPINNPKSDLDIKGAVKRAMKEVEKDNKERKTHG